MIYQYFTFVHGHGMHLYTIPAIITIIAMIILGAVHWYKQLKREKEFDKTMKEKFGEQEQGAENASESQAV